MKRISVLLLILLFAISAVGCKNNKEDLTTNPTTTSGIIYASDPDSTDGNNSSDNNSDSSENESDTDNDTQSDNTVSDSDNLNNNSNSSNNDGNTNNSQNNSGGNVNEQGDNNGNGLNNGNNSSVTSGTNSDTNSDNTSDNNTDTNNNNSDPNNDADNPDNSNPSNTTGDNSSSATNGEEDYKSIDCRKIADNEWTTIELVSNSNKLYISLSVPSDWVISDDGLIYRNDIQIGTISSKSPGTANEVFEQHSKNEGTVLFKNSIEKFVLNGVNVYKRNFKASEASVTGANNLHVTVNYSELDNNATSKIFNSLSYCGIDRKIPTIENNSKKFLILGNSFITSSLIDVFLSDMLITDGAKYVVETKTINNAEVADFASDSQLINSIGNGEYAYIFQCGFYNDLKSWGSADAEGPLKTIIDACNKSDTGLIVFPAHNESSPVINRALEKYTDIYCINWKNEINNLINSGIGESSPTSLTEADFCQNDNYKHSTPLAGYVGAHMIYRNIFGKVPPALSATAPLSMSVINSKLNNYSTTGIVPGKSAIHKYYV